MKHAIAITLATFALAPALAETTSERLCVTERVAPGADGRLLGHLPYGQTSEADLVAAPPGFAIGLPCRIRREVAPDLQRLLAAADATPGVAGRLRAVSCFRTIARQGAVFCSQVGPGKRCRNAAERARFVGPPGYSEHATGYAIDFGTRPSPGCADVEACFAQTAAGRWLIANAPNYGFELSFPAGNAQGVSWEPWHWRWVGSNGDVPGAAAARNIFVRARFTYPAMPTTPDGVARLLQLPGYQTPTTAPRIEVPPLR